MTFRTRLWGIVGQQAKAGAEAQFSKLPPLVRSPPVTLTTTAAAWGVPNCDVKIAHGLDPSMIGFQDRMTQNGVHFLLKALPNTQRINRWDIDTATEHLTDIFGGKGRPNLWPDWRTDEGWARTFVQGPCAGDLKAEGDVWVVDATALALGEPRPGVAGMGVKVALTIDEQGPRPAWIQLQDGTKVRPDQGNAWGAARIIASAGLHNWVATVRHVVFLHYCAAQHFSILVHNHLPWEHPLHRMLYPHVAGTLLVNWGANQNFMWPGKIAENTYAFSWKGICDLVPVAFGAFSWEGYDLPEEFVRRGTDKLIAKGLYPYGEDALLLWETIDTYVGDYLKQYYANDEAVRRDTALQEGLTALDEVMPGKPLRANSLAELQRMLTRFIHMVGPEHKLVSGIAYDYFTQPYFFPSLAHEGRTAEEAAPYREEAEANLMFRYAISTPSWPLMADWTYVCLDEKGKGAMRRFQTGLAKAGEVIDRRNAKRKVPFPHLHPRELESSIGV
jgi:hypothetical protein